jgi:transposase-like protein
MPKKSELKAETRVEIVLALLRREEPVAVLSRRYQVSEQTIYRWRDQFLEAGKAGLLKGEKAAASDERAREVENLRSELGKRAQVIGELTLANDLLKKLQARSY